MTKTLKDPESSLTAEQVEAILSTHSRVCCIAGPGAGKTAVLIERIFRLISESNNASGIACITFTNEAAKEIQARLASFAECFKIGFCGTLHSFMLCLLRRYSKELPTSRLIAVMDEAQKEAFIYHVAAELCLTVGSKLKISDVKEAVALGPDAWIEAKPMASPAPCDLIAFSYYQKMIQSGVIDFDSILKFGNQLLKKIVMPFDHILWDEFQDSSGDDFSILTRFAESAASLFVVGDPDQSIFGFRAAGLSKPTPKFLLTLARSQKWQQVVLGENFRCAAKICDAANALIAHNGPRVYKTRSATNDPGQIEVYNTDDDTSEICKVGAIIREDNLFEHGTAVLLRTNKLVERFSNLLRSIGIPVKERVRIDRPQDWAIARLFINLMANPRNEFLVYRWLALTKGVGFAESEKLRALSEFRSLEIDSQFWSLTTSLMQDLPVMMARQSISPESIKAVLKAAESLPAGWTMTELSLALADEDIHIEEEGLGITICTIHASKGREFDNVFLPAFEHGIFPSLAKNADIAEERRLAYVAITRARHRVFISYAKKRLPIYGTGGRHIPATCSQFIAEMGFANNMGATCE